MKEETTISWIFLSTALASDVDPTDFDGISMIADGINHAIPTHKELQESIKLLIENGLVEKSNGKYCLTNAGKQLYRSASDNRTTLFEIWKNLEARMPKKLLSDELTVLNSWNLNGIGIIAELKHYFNGLKTGVIVQSNKTKSEWTVKSRVLYSHIIDRQTQFPDEITELNHLTFASNEKKEISGRELLSKDENHIYHYILNQLGLDAKLENGDSLRIVKDNK